MSYLEGLQARAVTFGTAAFDLLDSEAEGPFGDYGEGFRTGLMNIESVSA
ncbi:hypothetical protein [Rhizobium johnstonii]